MVKQKEFDIEESHKVSIHTDTHTHNARSYCPSCQSYYIVAYVNQDGYLCMDCGYEFDEPER